MTIERKSADTIIGFATRAEAERYCDQDLLIRQGMCPNGHGLMPQKSGPRFQQCPKCRFCTNVMPEKERAN